MWYCWTNNQLKTSFMVNNITRYQTVSFKYWVFLICIKLTIMMFAIKDQYLIPLTRSTTKVSSLYHGCFSYVKNQIIMFAMKVQSNFTSLEPTLVWEICGNGQRGKCIGVVSTSSIQILYKLIKIQSIYNKSYQFH